MLIETRKPISIIKLLGVLATALAGAHLEELTNDIDDETMRRECAECNSASIGGSVPCRRRSGLALDRPWRAMDP
jgi:hypothetical protein